MKIAVVGIGHVGLVTAASLAAVGHDVAGTDADSERVARVREGIAPFFEPGLEELLGTCLASGRLRMVESTAEAVAGAEIAFICVGTPARANGEANLLAVEHAARDIARAATGPLVVADKSTVPIGTAERVGTVLALERPGVAFDVVSNPEFLREGKAVEDALRPARILVGSSSERSRRAMRDLYEPFVAGGARLFDTDVATAELAKHAANAFLALKVSYANALARLCERAEADVVAVAEIMGSDPRIGREHLDAGLGWGGYCFPKDLAAFQRLSERLGYPMPLLAEVARLNEEAVRATLARIEEAVWNLEEKRVALLGLSFKPGTDDVRFSPALALARLLAERGARVVGSDPRAGASAKAEMPGLEVVDDPYAAAAGAHAVVVCTAWEEYRALDLARLREAMAYPVLVDGRNMFDPEVPRAAGFTYLPMGRPAIRPVV